MNQRDSWIDLDEVADLVSQLAPDKDHSRADKSTEDIAGAFFMGPASNDSPANEEAPEKEVTPTKPAASGNDLMAPRGDLPPEWQMVQPGVPTANPPSEMASEPAQPLDSLTPKPVLELGGKDSDSEATPDVEIPALVNPMAQNTRRRALRSLEQIRREADEFIRKEEKSEELPAAEPAEAREHAYFIPAGPLRVRLEAYADWVCRVTDCQRILISDDQGHPLLSPEEGLPPEDATLLASSLQMMAASAAARQRLSIQDSGQGVYLPLPNGSWLGVLECDSSFGHICVGIVTEAPLSPDAANEVTEALIQTLGT